MASSSVEVVEILPIKRNRQTVVTGFAGPGFIGRTAVMHIIGNRVFRQLAYVRSQLIPPMMLLTDGRPTHAFRIYGSEKDEMLLVTTDAMIPAGNSWPVGLKLMDWLLSKSADEFISIEGTPFTARLKERVVLGFSTHRQDLTRFGVHPTNEGVVSGMNACMLEECLSRNLSWTSLFVPTNLVSTIDHGGAAAVIEVLNRMFKLGVDVEPLKEREEMMRKMVEKQMRGKPRGLLDALRGIIRSFRG